MATGPAPKIPVSPPANQPEVASLLRSSRDALGAAVGGDETNGRWIGGFSYLPESNSAAVTVGPCAPGSLGTPTPALPLVVDWQPVVVTVAIRCTIDSWRGIDWEGRARRLLDLATPKALEKEFWSGTVTQAKSLGNLYLTMAAVSGGSGGSRQTGPIDLTTGSPTLKRAMSILEQAIADTGAGARGMIHTRVEATPDFLGIRRDGNILVSHNDTIVVPGAGYPNTGPGAAAPSAGNTWLFATGLTDVRLDPNVLLTPDPRSDGDPDWLIKATDRSVGTVTVFAQRFAIVSWDGLVHYACQAVIPT